MLLLHFLKLLVKICLVCEYRANHPFNVDNKDNSVYVKYKDINGKYSYVWLPMRGIENKSRRRIIKAKVRF